MHQATHTHTNMTPSILTSHGCRYALKDTHKMPRMEKTNDAGRPHDHPHPTAVQLFSRCSRRDALTDVSGAKTSANGASTNKCKATAVRDRQASTHVARDSHYSAENGALLRQPSSSSWLRCMTGLHCAHVGGTEFLVLKYLCTTNMNTE